MPAEKNENRQSSNNNNKPPAQTTSGTNFHESKNIPAEQVNIAEFKKLKLIHEINKSFQGTLNLKVLMYQILERVLKELKAEAGTFFMAYPAYNLIVCTEAIGPSRDKVLNMRIPLKQGVVGWCIEQQKPTIIYDTSKDERFSTAADQKTGFVTKSIICVPIVYKGVSLGAVELFNKKIGDGQFSDDDMEILKVIADNAGATLNNAKLHESEKRLRERTMVMNEFARSFAKTLELDQLLNIVLTKTIEALKSEAGSIWLYDDQIKKIECRLAEGSGAAKIKGAKLPLGKGIVGSVIQTKKMEIVLDAKKDKRFAAAVDKHTGFQTLSMLCMPLMDRDKSIGCIQIINKKGGSRQFDRSDVELLESVTAIASISIKNAQMYEKEKKIKELNALLKISKELNSSLDMESVTVSLVNLMSEMIDYDRAILFTEAKPNKYVISAVSGMGGNFNTDESLNKLAKIPEMLLENKPENYFQDIEKYLKDSAAIEQFKDYFKLAGIDSLFCKKLSDSEGNLGILIIESKTKNVLPADKKEMFDVLCNQASVALRNAQLYRSVPKFELFGGDGTKRGYKKYIAAVVIIAIIAALHFIKINYTINTAAEIVPFEKKYIYYGARGLLKKVYIEDGDIVAINQKIAEIDDADFKIKLRQLENQKKLIENDMLDLQMKGELLTLKVKENEVKKIELDIEKLKEQLKATDILAPISGQIFLKDAKAKVGEMVGLGKKFGEIVNLDKLKIKLSVPENKIQKIKENLETTVKFSSFPMERFNIKIDYYAPFTEFNDISKTYYYPAYGYLKNSEDKKLKISMHGFARIRAEKISILSYILEYPINSYYMNYNW